MTKLELRGYIDENPMRFELIAEVDGKEHVVQSWTDVVDFCYRPQRTRTKWRSTWGSGDETPVVKSIKGKRSERSLADALSDF